MNTTDKVSIINALMLEDRAEIRMNKNILVNITYFIVSGIIAITAFSISQGQDKHVSVYLVGIWSLFVLYASTFLHYKRHLLSLRLCLEIRENYYKNLEVLEKEDPFKPLKSIDKSKPTAYPHDYMYFLPILSFIVTAVNTWLILWIF